MKNIILFFTCILAALNGYGQIIKIDNGFSFTHLNTKKFNALSSNISSYTGFIGLEYFNKKWLYLSSGMGYIRIGGKETNKSLEATDPMNYKVFESFDYAQINTTIRAKSSFNGVEFYLGAGPYLNILLDDSGFHSSLYDGYETKDINWGLKTEAGFAKYLNNKIKLELNGTYLINISSLATSPYNSFDYKAFSILLGIGYNLD